MDGRGLDVLLLVVGPPGGGIYRRTNEQINNGSLTLIPQPASTLRSSDGTVNVRFSKPADGLNGI